MAGAGLDRQLAADQEGALAHAGDAEAALGVLEGEAAAVVGDLELDAVVEPQQPDLDRLGLAVSHRVRERLLGDAIDDELHVVVEAGEVALLEQARRQVRPAGGST